MEADKSNLMATKNVWGWLNIGFAFDSAEKI